MKTKITLLSCILFISMMIGCRTEKILTEEWDSAVLNGPIGISIVPGTDIGLVTNSNYKLDYATGALSVIDLTSNSINSDSTIELANFSGQIFIDDSRGRILIPNRLNNSLIVYDYSIPGSDGKLIDFTQPELPNSYENLKNQIELEEDPFGILLSSAAGLTPKIFVTNVQSGDISSLNADDLSVNEALNEDKDSVGIPLLTLPNLGHNPNINDGVGANRMAPSVNGRLVFVTSSRSSLIFIIDSFDDKVEGVLDLSVYSPVASGMRGIVITSDSKLYASHRALGGVIVLDVSDISDNGINNENLKIDYVDFIPTGAGPEGLAVDNTESKLYVCNEEQSSVSVIDLASLSLITEIPTEKGPTEIAMHPVSGLAYVTNFFSNSISIIDTATDTVSGVIK